MHRDLRKGKNADNEGLGLKGRKGTFLKNYPRPGHLGIRGGESRVRRVVLGTT